MWRITQILTHSCHCGVQQTTAGLQGTCPVASESCSERWDRRGGDGGRGQVEGLQGQWGRVSECSTGMVITGKISLSVPPKSDKISKSFYKNCWNSRSRELIAKQWYIRIMFVSTDTCQHAGCWFIFLLNVRCSDLKIFNLGGRFHILSTCLIIYVTSVLSLG